ncbi:MAG: sodium:solute symporter family protein [Deltaproteobacteria bacterium]|nr:sodium:solute symporter family protein [Deltaproteobacteria bacterium]
MLHLITITLYLFLLIGIGLKKTSKVQTQEDFAVAGRGLSPWILVGTMLATWIGTGSILGNAGKAYQSGIATVILPLGSVLGIILLTQIAEKARNFNKFTVPEIIGERYGNTARVLAVIALVMAYMVIVSYQYNAGGAVLYSVLQNEAGDPLISLQLATIVAALFIVAYTAMAGLLSVAYTDVANGVIIIASFVIALPILYFKAGGISGMSTSFAAMGKESHMQLFGVFSTMDLINFCLPPFLLVLGDANMYQRFFASKDGASAKTASRYLVPAVLVAELMIIVGAWMSSSLIPDAANGRHVLIYAASDLLPPILGAVMLTTIVGIIISTADSYLLVPATTLMRDIYLKYVNPNASEKSIVFLSRVLVLTLGFIAYLVSIGFAASATFFEKSLYAYTIYGAAITPALVAAFFWKGATKWGAILSIISGTVMTLIWKELPQLFVFLPESIRSGTDEVLPAITVSVFFLVVGSLLTKSSATKERL